MDYFKINKNVISFINYRYEFEEPIAETIIISNKFVIVRLETKNYENDINVFGYSFEGKFLWQIEAGDYPNGKSKVSGIYVEGVKFFAYRFSGFEEEIDLETGKILNSVLIK